MSVVFELVMLAVGLVVLIVGADLLVRGAAQLARVMGLSAFAIGVTVVAFGTSAPELFASIGASLLDKPDLAVGNVVGSNIANILLILGVGAIIAPLAVQRRVRLVELPIMLAITIGATMLMLDHTISRIEGAALFLGLVGYVIFIVKAHRVDIEHEGDEVVTHPKSVWIDVLFVALGVAGLGLGAKALVWGASALAIRSGVSAGVVGTTIVALGTSLPELAATARAALSRDSDIAVGNVVGSNIFNLLSVLGVTAMIQPLAVPQTLDFHIWTMLAISLVLVMVVLVRPRLGRFLGILCVLLYAAYIAVSFLRA